MAENDEELIKIFKKIVKLSGSRIDEMEQGIKDKNPVLNKFYKGAKTYASSVVGEMEEAIDEMKKNNSVYLEDELGDVLWTYMCLLQSLEKQGDIDSVKNVFKRCGQKFSERVGYVRENRYEGAWEEIKKKQKIERKKEHDEKYGK